MKKQRIIAMLLILVFVFSQSFLLITAHPSELDVDYDPCLENSGDGYYEKWYEFIQSGETYHIPSVDSTVTTIKYYISPTAENDSSTTWYTGLTSEQAEKLISSTIASMKKWNNVYFYKYNSDGNISSHKLVDIIEGTESDHNLIIYPATQLVDDALGTMEAVTPSEYIEEPHIDSHIHYTFWKMKIRTTIYETYGNSYVTDLALERIGAHEIGHLLGLRDIDKVELPDNLEDLIEDKENKTEEQIEEEIENLKLQYYHHEELLMGYSRPNRLPQKNITYKDLVGVAITRGYHTDADHKWICVEDDPDEIVSKFRLICSICNGVKEVDSLLGYDYVMLNSCNQNHELSSGNMMAVARYGNKDYYKCKYCRYVAPFEDIVPYNYVLTNYSNTHHAYVNQVQGLEYTLLEKHNLNSDNVCVVCNYSHTHDYTSWTYKNASYHMRVCLCGNEDIAPHVIRPIDAGKRFARCLDCNAMLDLHENQESIMSYTQLVTLNGSYTLPNGIIVLAEEDAEAYYNGTLVFYKKDDVPEME